MANTNHKQHTTVHKQVEKHHKQPSFLDKIPTEIQIIGCIAGIYFFYLMFGFLQEEITTMEFGEKNERFHYTAFLLLVQSLINTVCAYIVLLLGNFPRDKTPFVKYSLVSLTSIGAMFCSNKAIMFVDYPTQVLAKSCKPIPVMLMGLFAFRKKYSLSKYLVVLTITIGIALFMLNPPAVHHHHKNVQKNSTPVSDNVINTTTTITDIDVIEQPSVSYIGISLLLLSLALDGITGPFQENLIEHYHPSSTQLMFYSTIWQSLFMSLGAFVSGEILPAVNFLSKYPSLIPKIVYFSLCSACGQIFIYYTVHQFGSLYCTMITTTRKFFSILGSVFWFDHPLTSLHWFSITLVFAGLLFDLKEAIVRKYKGGSEKNEKEKEKEKEKET